MVTETRRGRGRAVPSESLTAGLSRLVQGLGPQGHLGELLQHVTDTTASLLRVDRVTLRLLDAHRDGLLVAARTGGPVHDENELRFGRGEGLVGHVITSGAALRSGAVLDDPRFVPKAGGRMHGGSFLGAALRDEDGCFGVLAATSDAMDAFDQDDERLLSLICGIVAPQLEVRRLARLAQTDPLTGMLNRRGLSLAIPDDDDAPLTIALVDIDHFKRINDQHGHPAGDLALCEVARVLGQTVPSDAALLRLGGEEFLVALPAVALLEGECVAQRLRRSVRDGIRIGDAALTISIGLPERRPGERRDELLARADAALYQAKAQGRDRVVLA